MNKLKNFPSVFYVSLEESIDRQDNIKSQFNKYEINPIPLISKRYSESTDVVNGRYVHEMNPGTIVFNFYVYENLEVFQILDFVEENGMIGL